MTRARNSMPAHDIKEPALDQQRIENAMVVMREGAISAEDQIRSEIYELGETIGGVKAFGFIATVSTHIEVKQFEKAKKSKAWKYLVNPNSETRCNFESLDEYCRAAFGKGYRRMMQMSANLHLLGQEVHDRAEQLGLGQREFDAMKTLAADDKEVVRRAIEEAQSREEVIDLLQEMAARHVSEREASHAEIDYLKGEVQAKEHISAEKSQQIEELREKVARIKLMPPDDVLAELHREATAISNDARGAIIGQLRQAMRALNSHHEIHGGDSRIVLGGLVGQLVADLAELRAEFDLPEVRTGDHDWINQE